PSVPQRFSETVEAALIRLLREHRGHLTAGQRTLGRTLGVSATHINRVLAKQSASGIISLNATRRGSAIRLVVAGTAEGQPPLIQRRHFFEGFANHFRRG